MLAAFSDAYFTCIPQAVCLFASRLRNAYCLKRSEDPRRMNDIYGFIWHKLVIAMIKYSFICEIKYLFIIVSIAHHSRLVYVLARKDLCFGTRRQVACGIMLFCLKCSEDPGLKLYLRFHLTQISHSNGKILFL